MSKAKRVVTPDPIRFAARAKDGVTVTTGWCKVGGPNGSTGLRAGGGSKCSGAGVSGTGSITDSIGGCSSSLSSTTTTTSSEPEGFGSIRRCNSLLCCEESWTQIVRGSDAKEDW